MLSPDLQHIQHIKMYCERITQTINRCGADYEVFVSDVDLFQSVSMSMMQLGEHSIKLSNAFKEASKHQIPWKEIHGMRVMYAHQYESMSKAKIWATAVEDIPLLLKFCNKTLSQNRGKESTEPDNKPSILRRIEEHRKSACKNLAKSDQTKSHDPEL